MPSRRRSPPATRRRVLELLAGSRDGCTEAMMLAHGCKTGMMVEIVNGGRATAKAERVVAGNRPMEVTRVRITEAGRHTLVGLRS
jgi:hypothetical protein